MTEPRSVPQRAVLQALAFREADTAMAALPACGEQTPDDLAFVAGARAAAMQLQRHPDRAAWAARAKRLGSEATDPVIRAFCRVPVPRPVDPAIGMPLVDQVARVVGQRLDDSLAAYLQVQVAELRASLSGESGGDLDGVWEGRGRWPGLAARVAAFRGRRLLRERSYDAFDALIDAALEGCAGARGRVVDRLHSLRVHGFMGSSREARWRTH